MSFIEDFQSLDYEDPGGWKPIFKVLAAVIVIALIVGGGYWFKIKNDLVTYQSTVDKEAGLRSDFENKQRKASQLDEYREQFAKIQEKLDELVKQLPNKTQIPRLLQTISQKAIETDIDVDRFEPQPETLKDVFAEKPISIKMVGGFHKFGKFVSEIADLKRVIILTMTDITLAPNDVGDLVLEGTVKTYRSIDEDEQLEIDTRNNNNQQGARR